MSVSIYQRPTLKNSFRMKVLSHIRKWVYSQRERNIKRRLGFCGKDNNILPPCSIGTPQNVYLYDYTLVQPGATFIIAGGEVHIHKWSSLSFNCTVVTGNHCPTVGVNQRILERLHMNDKESDVVVSEDCWVGANVTLLSGTNLGRGVVVGACSLVNKEIPPYAVVVGIPAKIIAPKFTLEQVLEHERMLYSEEERLSVDYLTNLFETRYKGLRSIGTDHVDARYVDALEQNKRMQYSMERIERACVYVCVGGGSTGFER